MNEAAFWRRVRKALNTGKFGVAHKLSAEVISGTPDCLWAIEGKMGLLELKYVPAWPKRSETPVKVNLSPDQRRYLEGIAASGNRANVLLGVGDEWFLLKLSEVPAPTRDGTPPRIGRMALNSIRSYGRSGMLRELDKLRVLLRDSLNPVYEDR